MTGAGAFAGAGAFMGAGAFAGAGAFRGAGAFAGLGEEPESDVPAPDESVPLFEDESLPLFGSDEVDAAGAGETAGVGDVVAGAAVPLLQPASRTSKPLATARQPLWNLAISAPSGLAGALLVVRCRAVQSVVARRQASAGSLALAQLGRGEIGTGQDAGAGSAREFVECRGQCGLGYDKCDHLVKAVPRPAATGSADTRSMVTPPTAKPAYSSRRS